MKTLKSPFEINWPLPRRHAPIYAKQAGVQHYVLLLYSSGEWPQGFYLSAAASTRLGTLHTKEDTVLVFLNYQSHFVINWRLIWLIRLRFFLICLPNTTYPTLLLLQNRTEIFKKTNSVERLLRGCCLAVGSASSCLASTITHSDSYKNLRKHPNLDSRFPIIHLGKVQLFWEGHKMCAIVLMVLKFT